MGLYALCLLTVTIKVVFGSPALHPDVLEEGHAILKRFADAKQEYTSHEVADVLHQKESDVFHRISKRDLRSVTEDNKVKRLRLDLSSGSSLHLHLKKRSLFASDTQFFYNTDRGQVKRQTPPEDCYATGHVEIDGKFDGTIVVSLCDGLHGTGTSKGVEYYIHPVKTIQGEHKVHVLSRRTIQNDVVSGMGVDELYDSGEIYTRQKRDTVTADTYKTANGFVIELAIFVDEHYHNILKEILPDREDEFVLMTTAAVQTRYSNEIKVGYSVHIKVKLLMTWLDDPGDYTFGGSVGYNAFNFYNHVKNSYGYEYDIYFLLTGVTMEWYKPFGYSFRYGVCTNERIAAMRSIDNSRITVMARQIGHLLGFRCKACQEGEENICPEEYRTDGDGFMESGEHFTRCNKWELEEFFSKGKGQCLFEETAISNTSEKAVNLPSVLPGQYQSPDEQCRMFAGEEYEFYSPFNLKGKGECLLWMCINLNKTSSQYLRVVKRTALRGYPCDRRNKFCWDSKCTSWTSQSPVWWDIHYLQQQKRKVAWSRWPRKWSKCVTSDCNVGVEFKKRQCKIKNGIFVRPYCRGLSIKAQRCHSGHCSDNEKELLARPIEEIRQARGNEVCARFYDNNVPLENDHTNGVYWPEAIEFGLEDSSSPYFKSRSCMLTCKRSPPDKNKLDGILPDGTPCTESKNTKEYINSHDIRLICVQGVCKEI